VNTDTVETIRKVNLQEIDRSMDRGGLQDRKQATVKCTAKLHCFGRCGFPGVRIDARECIVNNEARSPVTLWYHTQRGNAESREIFDGGERQDHPETLGDELHHFLLDKSDVVLGRGVAASGKRCRNHHTIPRGGGEFDWCPVGTELFQEGGSRMGQ
jgi:hypothetical protein